MSNLSTNASPSRTTLVSVKTPNQVVSFVVVGLWGIWGRTFASEGYSQLKKYK